MAESRGPVDKDYSFDMAAAESARRPFKITLSPGTTNDFYQTVWRVSASEGFEAHIESMKMDFDFAAVSLWRDDMAIFGAHYRRSLEFELSILIDRSKGGSVSIADGMLAKLEQELVQARHSASSFSHISTGF